MATFRQKDSDAATVDATAAQVWAVLTDPQALVRLTPLLEHIEADGDTWVWRVRGVSGLGLNVTPEFTEAMSFVEPRSIRFRHAPPPGKSERVGVEGLYELRPDGDRTHLSIDLEVSVDLPLPKASAPAVHAVMRQTMGRMGSMFAKNLVAELARPAR